MKAEMLLRFLVALTCILFIVSIFYPFLEAQTGLVMHIPEIIPGPIRLWSFKVTYEYGQMGRGWVVEEWWFPDYLYRFYDRGALRVWIGPALIFMLEAQVFTALFAALAVLRPKLSLLLTSTSLNVFTLFCMWFVSQALSSYYPKFQAGFWLTFLTAALFLTTTLLSWWFRRKAADTAGTNAHTTYGEDVGPFNLAYILIFRHNINALMLMSKMLLRALVDQVLWILVL